MKQETFELIIEGYQKAIYKLSTELRAALQGKQDMINLKTQHMNRADRLERQVKTLNEELEKANQAGMSLAEEVSELKSKIVPSEAKGEISQKIALIDNNKEMQKEVVQLLNLIERHVLDENPF